MADHYPKHAASTKNAKKKRGFFGHLFRFIGTLILIIVIAAVGGFGYLSLTEFKPADSESVDVSGLPDKTLSTDDTVKVMTWNIGYGALGDNADFFMDGGSHVVTADEDRVGQNLEGIEETVTAENPDILMVQEIDRDCTRTYGMDELVRLQNALPEYASTFANNFKVAYVPYPLPPIGKVDSGIATFSSYQIDSADREQLPIPFKWPVRVANIKRCVLVSRIKLADSDKELVMMNLHLEAYDNGEGKAAQTKKLAELLQAEADKGNYVIAGGDFNQIFSSEDATLFPAQEGKWAPGVIDVTAIESNATTGDWQFLMDETNPSCRSLDQPYAGYVSKDDAGFQFYLIDGFIVSGNITVEKLETKNLEFVNSDHNPVVMELKLNK